MPTPNTISEKGRPPVTLVADPAGVTVESVASPLPEPASGEPAQDPIQSSLLEFVRVLARTAAVRDWRGAVADLVKDAAQPEQKEPNEK